MFKTEVVAVKLSLMAETKLKAQINMCYSTNLKSLEFKTRTLRLCATPSSVGESKPSQDGGICFNFRNASSIAVLRLLVLM